MKFSNKLTLILTIIFLSIPVLAISAAQVKIDTLTEKQEIIEIDGVKKTRFVQTGNAVPGDVLRFTLKFSNSGDATAENVVLNNPIPPNAYYRADSATSFENVTPLFSIDNGTSFKTPSTLTYEVKTPDGGSESLIAKPEKYTHIRWQLPPLPAGAVGLVSFDVLIK